MQEACETLDKLANLSLSSDSGEEIEVIYVENLSGPEIVEFARYGELQILEELIKMGSLAKLIDARDLRGNTALHMASANGHLETVNFILSACSGNMDFINQKNDAQNTALHWSCLNGHYDVTRLLLDHGADYQVQFLFADF